MAVCQVTWNEAVYLKQSPPHCCVVVIINFFFFFYFSQSDIL